MATFLENLWGSIFTPGTTPTLLVATNVSFGALQIVLFALLLATWSIHLIVLSILCAGLWYSINWFATELKAAEAEKDESIRKGTRQGDKGGAGAGESADDEGEDTEVEERGAMGRSVDSISYEPSRGDERVRGEIVDALKASGAATGGRGAGARQRKTDEGDRSGEISTDSEWERVSQEGDR